MRKIIFPVLAALSPALTHAAENSHQCIKQNLNDFTTLFYAEKQTEAAFTQFVAEDYIQHSKGIDQGRDAAVEVLAPMFSRPGFNAEPVRVSIDDELATLLLKVSVNNQVIAMVTDIYRFEDCKIQEHWDVKIELSEAEAAVYFDGLTR